MPKIATDYSTRPVSFYRFVCQNPDIKCCYVGSTVDFCQRKRDHKSVCHNETHSQYNNKLYKTIRANGGWDNWKMIEIESRLVSSKREAEKIEQDWIEKLEADLNMVKAYLSLTQQERTSIYYHKNTEKFLEYARQYREENKEIIKEKGSIYRKNNKELLSERAKFYRDTHSEIVKEGKKVYYENNKDEINQRRKEKYNSNKEEFNKQRREKSALKKLEKLKSAENT